LTDESSARVRLLSARRPNARWLSDVGRSRAVRACARSPTPHHDDLPVTRVVRRGVTEIRLDAITVMAGERRPIRLAVRVLGISELACCE